MVPQPRTEAQTGNVCLGYCPLGVVGHRLVPSEKVREGTKRPTQECKGG